MYSTFSEPLATINNFIALNAPSEASLNERYAHVERVKFEMQDKYRLHQNNYVIRSKNKLDILC
jgi:hypothetical protein